MNEREALERMQAGDIAGLEVLAQDLVQTAFLRAFERIKQFDTTRPFGPWFLKLVLNDAIKAANRRGRELSLDASLPSAMQQQRSEPVDQGLSPERALEQAETADQMWTAASQPGPRKLPGQVAPGPSPSTATAMRGKPAESGEASDIQRILNSQVVDTFWIDRQTFVPLKAVQNHGPKGVSTYEVSAIEFDVTLPPVTFEFHPPAGVQMLADPPAIKQKLAGR